MRVLVAEDEREFDYLEGSNKGPSRWGELRKEWGACKKGNLQSPIDMSSARVKVIPKMREVKRSYNPANATLINRGHDISVSKPHHPSEHNTIDSTYDTVCFSCS